MRTASKTVGSHGGQRLGAGRHNLSGTQNHMARPRIRHRDLIHIIFKTKKDIPDLRRKKRLRLFYKALTLSRRHPWKIHQHALESKKIHFIVHSPNNENLSQSLQSFSISLAKALNRHLKRRGQVFHGRYQMTVLRTQSDKVSSENSLRALFQIPKFQDLIHKVYQETIALKEVRLAMTIKALGGA